MYFPLTVIAEESSYTVRNRIELHRLKWHVWSRIRACRQGAKVQLNACAENDGDKGGQGEGVLARKAVAVQVQTRRQLVRTYYHPPGESRQLHPSSRAHTQR